MTSYHRRINISGNEALPLAVCKLGSGSNLPGYYMYHGGTNPYNPEHTMGETQASPTTNHNDMPVMTYDFQCPLGEMGQPNLNAFHQTRLLHQFLADWGEDLAVMPVDSLSGHYARRGCFEFYNDYVRIINEDGVAYVRPVEMPWHGHKVTADAQPLCNIGDTLYFIPIKGRKPVVKVDRKSYRLKFDKPVNAGGITVCVLSESRARRAFKIDGTLHFAINDGGILYKDGTTIMEEYWEDGASVPSRLTRQTAAPREVPTGAQKVAAMPVDSDFDKAAVYELDCPAVDGKDIDDTFIKISYQGDCARVYADGKLVEDNFWNGKPMLVRLSDIAGKKVELRILPLRKDAPIYLQKEQRDILNAADGNALLRLIGVSVLHRRQNTL